MQFQDVQKLDVHVVPVGDSVHVFAEGGSSLCSRVVELILPRSIEARLDAAVGPQPPNHAAQLR